MEDKFSKKDFQETLEKLFTFIPYFEERLNGTFKFQYCDGEYGKIADFEGYEEYNKTAKFEDPLLDETWEVFHKIVCRELWERVKLVQYFPAKDTDFYRLLRKLCYDTVHERMCTGYTASCIAKGIYLDELQQLQKLIYNIPIGVNV